MSCHNSWNVPRNSKIHSQRVSQASLAWPGRLGPKPGRPASPSPLVSAKPTCPGPWPLVSGTWADDLGHPAANWPDTFLPKGWGQQHSALAYGIIPLQNSQGLVGLEELALEHLHALRRSWPWQIFNCLVPGVLVHVAARTLSAYSGVLSV